MASPWIREAALVRATKSYSKSGVYAWYALPNIPKAMLRPET
jgi:hypothetical protein